MNLPISWPPSEPSCLVAGVDQEEAQEEVSRPKGMHLAQRRTSEIW
jgi:hypothetical protein